MKKALILTFCLGFLSAPAAFAQKDTPLTKNIQLSSQQIKALEEQTKQRELRQGESMQRVQPSCSLQSRAETAAMLGMVTLIKDVQANKLTDSEKTLWKKLLALYQDKEKDPEKTIKKLTELYTLLQHNQNRIPVAQNIDQTPGLFFMMLITLLPNSVDLMKQIVLNKNYKTELQDTLKLSPCSETN